MTHFLFLWMSDLTETMSDIGAGEVVERPEVECIMNALCDVSFAL